MLITLMSDTSVKFMFYHGECGCPNISETDISVTDWLLKISAAQFNPGTFYTGAIHQQIVNMAAPMVVPTW